MSYNSCIMTINLHKKDIKQEDIMANDKIAGWLNLNKEGRKVRGLEDRQNHSSPYQRWLGGVSINSCKFKPTPSLNREGSKKYAPTLILPHGGGKDFDLSLRKSEIQAGDNCINDNSLPSYHPIFQPSFKKVAFTLAEVLITLGIIGVVAAITMPSLIQKQTERATITKLKKEYSIMSNALMNAISEYGAPEHWEEVITYTNGENEMVERNSSGIYLITKYLKVIEDCGFEAKGCFAHKYKKFNGSDERDFENLGYYRKFILSDGTLVAMEAYAYKSSSTDRLGEIWVDVNGKNPPNVIGKDMFLFVIEKNGKVHPHAEGKVRDAGYQSTAWILAFDNMDYLHCNDKLSWEGKHSCK